MYREHAIAVVIPAYNEAENIGEVLRSIPDFVDRAYVIDDCSTDRTWEEIVRSIDSLEYSMSPPVVLEHTTGNEPVMLQDGSGAIKSSAAIDAPTDVLPIRHRENRGVGGAIKSGYRCAKDDGFDIAVVVAGDGQMDQSEMRSLLDPIVEDSVSYTKGNRLSDPEHHRSMPRWRLFGSLLLTFLTRVASGYWDVMDPQNGYTAIDLDALEMTDIEGLYDDFGFSNDLLIELNVHGRRISDVPMHARYGTEQSTIRYRTFIPGLSWLLARRFAYRLRVRYLYQEFHPLVVLYVIGATGLAASFALIRPGNRGKLAPIAFPISFLIGLVSLLCLCLAMTFDRSENARLSTQPQ